MPACPKCGEENPERARFCWSCGAAISETPRSGAEERKIVSALFVDLVGFTAASENAGLDATAALAEVDALLGDQPAAARAAK
jgi:class 3 adenylate cyclase